MLVDRTHQLEDDQIKSGQDHNSITTIDSIDKGGRPCLRSGWIQMLIDESTKF